MQKVQGFNVKAIGSHNCHHAVQSQVALVTLHVIVLPCTFTREQKLKTLVKLKPFNWDFAAGRTMLVRIDWNWAADCLQQCYKSHVNLEHECLLCHIVLECIQYSFIYGDWGAINYQSSYKHVEEIFLQSSCPLFHSFSPYFFFFLTSI